LIGRIFHSRHISFEQALREIQLQRIADRGIESFDFVIIAISSHYPTGEVNESIERVLGTQNYLAFHATDAFHDEEAVHHGVTALFIRFKREGRIECFVQDNISSQNPEILESTASYLRKRADAAHLIFAGMCNANLAFFIEKLSRYDIPMENLQGGICSGLKTKEGLVTYQFRDKKVIKDGFVIVTFHNVDIATSIATGFEPVGVQYTVTKAKGYRLYEVDDHISFARIIDRLVGSIENFKPEYLWYTPIVILDESSENLLTLRIFRDKKSEWVEFYGPVKEGQKIKLSYGEREQLVDADRKSAALLAKRMPHPEILFNFSCIARQYALEDLHQEENRVYRNLLHAPLFGFFTFGEIGHDFLKRSLQFYNDTSLLTGLKER